MRSLLLVSLSIIAGWFIKQQVVCSCLPSWATVFWVMRLYTSRWWLTSISGWCPTYIRVMTQHQGDDSTSGDFLRSRWCLTSISGWCASIHQLLGDAPQHLDCSINSRSNKQMMQSHVTILGPQQDAAGMGDWHYQLIHNRWGCSLQALPECTKAWRSRIIRFVPRVDTTNITSGCNLYHPHRMSSVLALPEVHKVWCSRINSPHGAFDSSSDRMQQTAEVRTKRVYHKSSFLLFSVCLPLPVISCYCTSFLLSLVIQRHNISRDS